MFPIVVSASRVQQFYCERNRAPYDLKALLRHLVHRVGIRVMEFTHGVKSRPGRVGPRNVTASLSQNRT